MRLYPVLQGPGNTDLPSKARVVSAASITHLSGCNPLWKETLEPAGGCFPGKHANVCGIFIHPWPAPNLQDFNNIQILFVRQALTYCELLMFYTECLLLQVSIL